jgi:hypothetical protein
MPANWSAVTMATRRPDRRPPPATGEQAAARITLALERIADALEAIASSKRPPAPAADLASIVRILREAGGRG